MATIRDEIFEFLANEGLRPQKEDFGIYFRYQMLNILIHWEEDDSHFISISLPNIFDVDDNNRFDVLTICNALNKERKVIKAVDAGSSVWVTVEQLLDQSPEYKDIIPRTLGMLLEARESFYEKLRNL